MLEKPDFPDEKIIACLQTEYEVSVAELVFLPLGADLNTAVYRAVANDATPYFVKLRRGDFDEASVTVPKYLSDVGIQQIIPPLPTRTDQLWARLDPYQLILYPFVKGQNAFERPLSDQQRVEFGAALKQFHSAHVPSTLTNSVPRETFSPRWRESVKSFLIRAESETFAEPITAELAAFLGTKSDETRDLIQRSEQLAQILVTDTPAFILCHGDIHGWNLLLDNHNHLFMVDWDTLIFAPKERDLMFVGSGLAGRGHSLEQEESLFYQGYGQTPINHVARAYYRYERIIEDIAVSCQHILSSDKDSEDRRWSLDSLKSNFDPQRTIEIAYQTDKTRQ